MRGLPVGDEAPGHVARDRIVAARTGFDDEPELALAIDPLVPTAPLIDSLRALSDTFPDLPVSFSTEGLGGSLRRLRSGSAALAICMLLPDVPEDIIAYPLLRVAMRPVVAPGHPLAALRRPASAGDLEPYVQLVLSDPVDPGGANYGLSSARLWRFVDLGRRMDFLLAGFCWCRMPEHLVTAAIASETLALIHITTIRRRATGSRSTRRTGGIARLVRRAAGCWTSYGVPSRLRESLPCRADRL